MTASGVKFFVGSLCLHLMVIALLVARGPAAHGVARSARSPNPSTPTLAVKILAAKTVPPKLSSTVPQLAPTMERPQPADTSSQQLAADGRRAAEPFAAPDLSLDAILAGVVESAATEDYLSPGSLTRLARPVVDIDLNESELTDLAVPGKNLTLTILVDARGMVVDVIPVIESDDMRVFAMRVAERFRHARFIPGEINGKPVMSQLRITVVSADFAAKEKAEIISIETFPARPAAPVR